MTSTITYDKIESLSYGNAYELLNNRTYVTDPRDPDNKKTRVFIYDFDPFHTSINFQDMPYIILDMPRIEYIRESVSGKRKKIEYTHRIVVRTARRGAGNTTNTDLGRTDMLNICDDLHELVNVVSKRQAWADLNMHKPKLTKISTDTYSVDQKYVYESVFELFYESPWLNTNE